MVVAPAAMAREYSSYRKTGSDRRASSAENSTSLHNEEARVTT